MDANLSNTSASRPAPPISAAPQLEEDASIGKAFYNKLEAKQIGIGPAFVESLEQPEESMADMLRQRTGTTLSRLSGVAATVTSSVVPVMGAAAEWVGETVGLVSNEEKSLASAVAKIRVKDMMVPGAELLILEVHQTVGQAEALLRQHHIHSVPVWHPAAKRWEGVVDTTDLTVWACCKFSKAQLDAWATFRQEQEFTAQRITDVINVSGRNPFMATTPETEALAVLEVFRDLDIHRVYVRRGEKDLVGVLTHSDIIRFLSSANFEAKSFHVGDKVVAGPVISCYEGELCVSAYKLMWKAGCSAVAVVNDKGQAVSALTTYDVVAKSESVITSMYKTIKEYQGRDQTNAVDRFVSVKPSATFGEVLEKMVAARVNHVFVVDDDGFPTAVLTARDILAVFLPQ